METNLQEKDIARVLVAWHHENPRFLPWKETDDPYRIWLSEVILQQTQVSQGVPYYEKFTSKYPDVQSLANADLSDILSDWQGLGYNSRAVNLKKAAESVVRDHGGVFPDNYEDILTLEGIGPYTAAAIASFAFGERRPVLDANVIRVLCRIYGITETPTRAHVRRQLYNTLNSMIEREDPAEFNQAIMNFGALLCRPRNPNCASCPFVDECIAYKAGIAEKLPIRKARKPRRERHFHYLVISTDEAVAMRQRDDSDIWPFMYDFPLREFDAPSRMTRTDVLEWAASLVRSTPVVLQISHHSDTQVLTHQLIHANFHLCKVSDDRLWPLPEGISYVKYDNLNALALPKVVDCYFRSNSILL